MKILNVNKFYYMKGGCETYYFQLADILRENGYEVIPFSMKGEKNFYSEYSEYFVKNIDYTRKDFKSRLSYAAKIIYSFEAKRKIGRLINSTKPDIAHLHNFYHQLSPSIIYKIKKFGIPIISTVHDLKIICPNYTMMNRKGICEECKDGKYYRCFVNRCVKNSKAGSFVNTVEAYIHSLMKTYSLIDRFICPSDFYRKKFIEFGIPQDKLINIPNFIQVEHYQPCFEHEKYFLYFGRLSEEKGIKTLIKAVKNIKQGKLVIAGTGPLESELKNMVENEAMDNVVFVGFKGGEELRNLIQKAMFVVVPSKWYENGPLSVLEAMACGKAIIGSNIGGIPEFIKNGETGLLFKPDDHLELLDKMNTLINNDKLLYEMGINARKRVEEEYNAELHFERIEKEYRSLI